MVCGGHDKVSLPYKFQGNFYGHVCCSLLVKRISFVWDSPRSLRSPRSPTSLSFPPGLKLGHLYEGAKLTSVRWNAFLVIARCSWLWLQVYLFPFRGGGLWGALEPGPNFGKIRKPESKKAKTRNCKTEQTSSMMMMVVMMTMVMKMIFAWADIATTRLMTMSLLLPCAVWLDDDASGNRDS